MNNELTNNQQTPTDLSVGNEPTRNEVDELTPVEIKDHVISAKARVESSLEAIKNSTLLFDMAIDKLIDLLTQNQAAFDKLLATNEDCYKQLRAAEQKIVELQNSQAVIDLAWQEINKKLEHYPFVLLDRFTPVPNTVYIDVTISVDVKVGVNQYLHFAIPIRRQFALDVATLLAVVPNAVTLFDSGITVADLAFIREQYQNVVNRYLSVTSMETSAVADLEDGTHSLQGGVSITLAQTNLIYDFESFIVERIREKLVDEVAMRLANSVPTISPPLIQAELVASVASMVKWSTSSVSNENKPIDLYYMGNLKTLIPKTIFLTTTDEIFDMSVEGPDAPYDLRVAAYGLPLLTLNVQDEILTNVYSQFGIQLIYKLASYASDPTYSSNTMVLAAAHVANILEGK